MRGRSMHTRVAVQRRRFRSLNGFAAAEGYDREGLDPLRVVALLQQRSGGWASRSTLATTLRLSARAVDDAVGKLESEGVVSASRTHPGPDGIVRLCRTRRRRDGR